MLLLLIKHIFSVTDSLSLQYKMPEKVRKHFKLKVSKKVSDKIAHFH